eukprot:s81_g5.t1
MRACTKGGDPATAMRVFAEVAEPSAMVFAAAISTCGAAGDWEIALDLLSAMEDAELNPDLVSFNAALAACHRAVKSKPALRLLEEIRRRELQPDVVSYSTVISACEEGRRWLQALRLLSSMGQVKVPPNVVTYSAAISACEKGRQWERALQLISEMQGSGVEPNVVSHASVLSACEKAQQWCWALQYWAQLELAGVRMNRVTYSAVIGAAGVGKHWDASVRLLAEMWARRVMPDVRNYTLALSTLEQARQWQLAVHLLQQMRQRKLKPDLICHSIVKRARFAGRLGRRSSRRLRLLGRPGDGAESTPAALAAEGEQKQSSPWLPLSGHCRCWAAYVMRALAGEQDLPADIKKEVVTKAAYTARAPKTGDEVRIRYVAVVNNWPVDTVDTSDGVHFTLGRGEVMEAWDRAVATMKKGETSKFTVPETCLHTEASIDLAFSKTVAMELSIDCVTLPSQEMYLSGGPDRFRQKLPDDGQEVLFEIELVAVRSITDLFGDGGAVQTILEDGDDYGPSPKVTDEVQINYVLSLPSGEVLDKRVGMDFRTLGCWMASPSMNEILCSKDGRGQCYAHELGIPERADVLVHMDLLQIYEFEDAGKKASWDFRPDQEAGTLFVYLAAAPADKLKSADCFEDASAKEENLVMKKAIKAVRSRLCPGFDGTWCKVKLLSATVGQELAVTVSSALEELRMMCHFFNQTEPRVEEEKLSEEVMVSSVVGNGEMPLGYGLDTHTQAQSRTETDRPTLTERERETETEREREKLVRTRRFADERTRKEAQCDALEAACACMRKGRLGEVALVTVKPIPSLHAPGVPNLEVPAESGNVVFKLEMIDFGNPPPEEGPSDSTDLLAFCQKQKERGVASVGERKLLWLGSAHFKAGRVRLAYERYSRVVALLPRYKRPLGSTTSVEVFEDPEERQAGEEQGPSTSRSLELKNTCRLNLAACALKLDLAYAAARFCDEVLKEDPKNVKALYRRAQGLLGSNDFEEAQRDCKAILEIEPANKDARLLLQKVRQAEKEQLRMQKEQFGASLVRKLA